MADTSTFRTACQLADHLHRPAQGKKAVEAMIADIQAALTVRTDFLLDGEHPLGEGRLQRPAVTHRSHPWLTGRAPLLYTLSPAAPLALYRAVVNKSDPGGRAGIASLPLSTNSMRCTVHGWHRQTG